MGKRYIEPWFISKNTWLIIDVLSSRYERSLEPTSIHVDLFPLFGETWNSIISPTEPVKQRFYRLPEYSGSR